SARYGDHADRHSFPTRRSSDLLDAMVELAGKEPGVLGARMTGAGFGGCTVNVVESEFAERAARAIQSDYNRLFSRPAATYVCARSEEHTSELQSLAYLVCRLLL